MNGMYGFAVEKWDARRREWEWCCGRSCLRNIGDLLQEVATETDGTNIPLCCALPLACSVTEKIKRYERDNQGAKTKLFNDPTVYGENSERVLEAGWRARLYKKVPFKRS